MKKLQLLFISTSLFGYFIITGWSSGPAHSGSVLNGTPGVATTGTCSNCHAGNSGGATTISNIRLTDDATGTLVTNGQYKPGHTYSIVLNASNTGRLPFYGFQVTARNAANRNAGSMVANQTGTAVAVAEGFGVVEHTTRLAAPVAGTYAPSFKWTAPAAGAGTVTMHAILNAVDGTGSVSGDAVSSPFSLALTEAVGTSVHNLSDEALFTVFPNPVHESLYIRYSHAGNYRLTIFNSTGISVAAYPVQTKTAAEEMTVPVALLPAGNYYLQINDGHHSRSYTLTKQ